MVEIQQETNHFSRKDLIGLLGAFGKCKIGEGLIIFFYWHSRGITGAGAGEIGES